MMPPPAPDKRWRSDEAFLLWACQLLILWVVLVLYAICPLTAFFATEPTPYCWTVLSAITVLLLREFNFIHETP